MRIADNLDRHKVSGELAGWPLVREKSGKFDFLSRSGKYQGILQIGQGNFRHQESQGKVREFHKLGPNLFGMQHFKCLKMLIFFHAGSILLKLM